MRALVTVGAAILMVGCDYSEKKFERQYVLAFCRRVETCQTWETLDDDLQSCVVEMRRDRQRQRLELDALRFDAFRAEECVGSMYLADCSEGPTPDPCDEVYVAD